MAGKEEVVSTTVTRQMKRRLQKLAEAEKRSEAQIVRLALEEYLDKHERGEG